MTLLSCTVQVDWAETGFRVVSVIMGMFSTLMMVCTILFALNNDRQLGGLAVLFLATFFLSFFIPMVLNCRHLKVADFLKGTLYMIFLSPTYVNIITVFAIANIHDVSWGSRPAGNDNNKLSIAAATEKKKGVIYRNFRSNFLIIWLLLNLITGFAITYGATKQREYILISLGGTVAFITMTKLIFSVLFSLSSSLDTCCVSKKKSEFFKNIEDVRLANENKDYKFNVFFSREFPHKAIIMRPGMIPKKKYYTSSLKEENIIFGISTRRVDEIKLTYWSGLNNVIKGGKWSNLKQIFRKPTNNGQFDSDESDSDE